jgi:hypothetical protein
MMVTVATKLDIPAKLTLPRASRSGEGIEFSVLGLGDIILPGIVMALALRFDLHMAYLRRQQNSKANGSSDTTIAKKVVEPEKPYFIPYHKHWHNAFWTSGLTSKSLPVFSRFRFPTPYFTATLISYPISMAVCWVAMSISRSGQPALFYLVPGLLGAIWFTALVRGEVKVVWDFHEAIVEEDEASKADKSNPGAIESKKDGNRDESHQEVQPVDESDLKADDEAKTPTQSGRKRHIKEVHCTNNLEFSEKNGSVSGEQVKRSSKLGDNVVALEDKFKREGDVDLLSFTVALRTPKYAEKFSSMFDENSVFEGYGINLKEKTWVVSKKDGKEEDDHVQKKLRTA